MKEFAKQVLSDVQKGEEFILHHGSVRKVTNLATLRSELEMMSNEEFDSHVTDKKNDFAAWVKDSVKDDKLAKDIMVAHNKDAIIDALSARIDFAVSIIEAENEKIISDELSRLEKLEHSTSKEKIAKDIDFLEKDLRKLSRNIDYENKLLQSEDDFNMKHWKDINPIPANARIAEFLFGLIVGVMLGMILFRFML